MDDPTAPGPGPGDSVGERATRAGAWRTHLVLVAGLALCAVAFWFELRRARSGNSLSWAYVFEWPLLAAFAVYMWWRTLNPDVRRRPRRPRAPAVAPEFEGMLAAWQEHVADLEATRRADAAPPDDEGGAG